MYFVYCLSILILIDGTGTGEICIFWHYKVATRGWEASNGLKKLFISVLERESEAACNHGSVEGVLLDTARQRQKSDFMSKTTRPLSWSLGFLLSVSAARQRTMDSRFPLSFMPSCEKKTVIAPPMPTPIHAPVLRFLSP